MSKPKEWHADVIVISGGGIKGAAFIGALDPLEEKYGKKFFKGVTYFAGSSIGAMICAGLVLGYSLSELKKLMYGIDMKKLFSLTSDEKNHLESIKKLFLDMGLDDGSALEKEIRQFVTNKEKADITFRELYEKTKQTLVVSGSCLNDGKSTYFSWYHTPDMSLCSALVISTRLPFFFTPVHLNEKIFIDGNFFDPFPIREFPKDAIDMAKKGNIIGIIPDKLDKSFGINDMSQFFTAFIAHISAKLVEMSSRRYKKYIIRLPLDVNGINFSVSSNVLEELACWGKKYGQMYFKKRGLPVMRDPCFGRHTKL